MRKLNSWLIGGIVLGIIAFIAMFSVLSSATKTEPMITAATTIRPDTQITASMLKVAYTRPSDIPPGALRNSSLVVGDYAAHTLVSGDPVLKADLAPSISAAGGSLTAPLGPGDRAMAVSASVSQALAGNITPGALVDVIEVANTGGVSTTQAPPTASYLVSKVRVLAVSPSASALSNASQNSTISGVAPKTGTTFIPGIYTLDVTAQEALSLALGESTGTLYLVLDPPNASTAPAASVSGPNTSVAIGPTPVSSTTPP